MLLGIRASLPRSILISTGLSALFAAFVWSGALWRVDEIAYDGMLRLTERPAPESVVLVGIDERSIAKLGRWPWPRRVHGELLQRLTEYGAKAVVLNLVLSEPDTDDPENDFVLARAMESNGHVVLPMGFGQLVANGPLHEIHPIPILKNAAARLGHVDAELDADGVVRSVFLKAGIGGANWPALSLAGLEEYRGALLPEPLPGNRNPNSFAPGWNTWVRDNQIRIPFAGPPGHFRTLSYLDVLRGQVPPDLIHDKVVVIGVTYTGGGDGVTTPVSKAHQLLPGIELHANVMDALQTGITIEAIDGTLRVLILTGFALWPLFGCSRLTPFRLTAVHVGAATALLWTSHALLSGWHMWLGPAPTLVVLILSQVTWSYTQWIATRDALLRTRSQAFLALGAVGEAVIATDVHGQIEFANQAGEKLLGTPFNLAQGSRLDRVLRLVHGNDAGDFDPINVCLKSRSSVTFPERTYLLSENSYLPVLGIAEPIFGSTGQVLGAIVILSDSHTKPVAHEKTLLQATHDVLTRLPNRLLFYDRLNQALSIARRGGYTVGVLVTDIDRFRAINTTFGLERADSLLRDFAQRISEMVRECDTVARLGSDQFGLVLHDPGSIEKVRLFAMRLLGACRWNHRIDGRDVFVTATIGISLFPRDGDDADALLARADHAVAMGKELGGNRCQMFTTLAEPLAANSQNFQLEQDLRLSLKRGELRVVYQPQVDIRTGRPVGVEALLRWRHPERGEIPPDQFIGFAEQNGLIEVIGGWVLQQACATAKRWQDAGFDGLRMAVNLSPRQFQDQALLTRIELALSVSQLAPQWLEVEITEGMLLKDFDGVSAILTRLQSMGIGVSIDDFGTGYASLSYLRKFPVSQIKIDKSFVRDLPTNESDQAIVNALLRMAENLHIDVIAEGVETSEQLDMLKRSGCYCVQGYLISQPLAAEDLIDMLASKEFGRAIS